MLHSTGLRPWIVGGARRSLCSAAVRRQAAAATPAVGTRQAAQEKISRTEATRGVAPPLIDKFNRQHDYLRISLTEKCNLRCFYCMPAEGIELSPKDEILTDDEIIRLARLFVLNGVNKIRLTGGEPSVRKGFTDLIARLAELRPLGLRTIGMTSNGLAIHRKLPQLVANGLTHLNVSLDTLDPFKFEIVTRRRGHEAVMSTIDTALSLLHSNPDRDSTKPSLKAVKVNVVVVKGLNDMEVLDFVEMTKEKEISVRFIEFMPFTGNKWDKSKIQPADVTLARIMEKYPSTARLPDEPNLTARDYKVPGHKGSFGLISSMTDHFCGTCNRLRITADGNIKVCLFGTNEVSLRDYMRSGASDDELLELIGRAVGNKKARHAGMENIDVVNNRPMILIGG